MKRPETPQEQWDQLEQWLEERQEARQSWLSKQEIGGLRENGLSLMEERWHQGYLVALRDVLSLMSLLTHGSGKPTSYVQKLG